MKIKIKLVTVLLSFFFVIGANAFCIPEWVPVVGGYCSAEETEAEEGKIWQAKLLESPGNQIKVQGVGNVCDYEGMDKFEYCIFGEE
jgi:hypothetical protein